MKKYIAGIITGTIITGTVAVFGATEQNITAVFNKIKLYVDGKEIKEETLLYNGTTYVPIRAAAEALGKEVNYNAETYTAYIGNTILEQIELPKKDIHLKNKNKEFTGEIEFNEIKKKELNIYNSYCYEIGYELKGILNQEIGDALNIEILAYNEKDELIQDSILVSEQVEKNKQIKINGKITVEKETKKIKIKEW